MKAVNAPQCVGVVRRRPQRLNMSCRTSSFSSPIGLLPSSLTWQAAVSALLRGPNALAPAARRCKPYGTYTQRLAVRRYLRSDFEVKDHRTKGAVRSSLKLSAFISPQPLKCTWRGIGLEGRPVPGLQHKVNTSTQPVLFSIVACALTSPVLMGRQSAQKQPE